MYLKLMLLFFLGLADRPDIEIMFVSGSLAADSGTIKVSMYAAFSTNHRVNIVTEGITTSCRLCLVLLFP